MASNNSRRLTDREIAVILRDNNPLIYGPRDRQRDHVEHLRRSGAPDWEIEEALDTLAHYQARVESYQAYEDRRIAEMPA